MNTWPGWTRGLALAVGGVLLAIGGCATAFTGGGYAIQTIGGGAFALGLIAALFGSVWFIVAVIKAIVSTRDKTG